MTDEHLLVSIALWPVRQTIGWLKNAKSVLTDYAPEDFVPPAIAESWDWLTDQVPRSLGFGTPGEQMSSSVVLAIASIFTSLFTGGITIFFVAVFAVTFTIGAFRLWPAFNDLWPVGEAEVV